MAVTGIFVKRDSTSSEARVPDGLMVWRRERRSSVDCRMYLEGMTKRALRKA